MSAPPARDLFGRPATQAAPVPARKPAPPAHRAPPSPTREEIAAGNRASLPPAVQWHVPRLAGHGELRRQPDGTWIGDGHDGNAMSAAHYILTFRDVTVEADRIAFTIETKALR